MIQASKAAIFVQDWIRAWNNHDIEKILEHYSDQVEFWSPVITQLEFNEQGMIADKKMLKKYFETGLKAYPELQFKLYHYYTGMRSIVICYQSVKGLVAAETFELDTTGKAVKVFCHYSS